MEKFIIATLISLCTTGLFAATWKGMIFHRPATWLKQRLPVLLFKPVCGCLICMSSIHTIIFWLFFRFNVLYIPVIILAVAGINTVITAIISPILPDETEEQE